MTKFYSFSVAYLGSVTVAILHRLFIWQCLHGIVPKGYSVYFDKYIDGSSCDKLVFYKNIALSSRATSIGILTT
jgi:hypothetical protein